MSNFFCVTVTECPYALRISPSMSLRQISCLSVPLITLAQPCAIKMSWCGAALIAEANANPNNRVGAES